MPEISSGFHLQKAEGQRYAIHIPHRHTLGQPVPLILLLHWGGKNYRYIGKDMLELIGFPAFSELQAIIVAPDRKRRQWATSQAREDLVKLINFLSQQYNLAPNKNAIVGFSMGGLGVWYLGSEVPKLFSCGVAVAAPIPEQIEPDEWRFPVYSIHGLYDEVFPHDINQQRAKALSDKGAPVKFKTVENASHTDIRSYIPAIRNSRGWIESIWSEYD